MLNNNDNRTLLEKMGLAKGPEQANRIMYILLAVVVIALALVWFSGDSQEPVPTPDPSNLPTDS